MEFLDVYCAAKVSCLDCHVQILLGRSVVLLGELEPAQSLLPTKKHRAHLFDSDCVDGVLNLLRVKIDYALELIVLLLSKIASKSSASTQRV